MDNDEPTTERSPRFSIKTFSLGVAAGVLLIGLVGGGFVIGRVTYSSGTVAQAGENNSSAKASRAKPKPSAAQARTNPAQQSAVSPRAQTSPNDYLSPYGKTAYKPSYKAAKAAKACVNGRVRQGGVSWCAPIDSYQMDPCFHTSIESRAGNCGGGNSGGGNSGGGNSGGGNSGGGNSGGGEQLLPKNHPRVPELPHAPWPVGNGDVTGVCEDLVLPCLG